MLEKITVFIEKHNDIFLFGTGKWSLPLKKTLENKGIRIHGMLVSHKCVGEDYFDGTPVYALDEMCENFGNPGIILAVHSKYHAAIMDLLGKRGLSNYLCCEDDFLRNCFREFNRLTKEKMAPYMGWKSKMSHNITSWNKVLIIRLDGIGDAVLMTPFLREFRRNHPESDVTLLTSRTTYNLFEECPYINRVFSIDTRKTSNGYIDDQLKKALLYMEKNFKKEHFDVSLVPRWDTDNYGASFLSFFSESDCKIAYSENSTRDKKIQNENYDKLFSYVITDNIIRHEIEKNMFFLKSIGCEILNDCLELWDNRADMQFVYDLLYRFGFNRNKETIAIGLSASNGSKMWEISNYFELMERISKVYPDRFQFVLLGGDDASKGASFMKESASTKNVINLVGALSLRQNFSLLKQSFLYVGNDTGLIHIAVAAQIRVLEVSSFPRDGDAYYGFSIVRFHPWKVHYYIAQPRTGREGCKGWCRKTYAHCINDVTVNDVFQGFVQLLSK